MTSTKILADSINPDGQRITTFLVVYPRMIHSEILTHRALSRNAASSRAIPIEKMLRDVTENPVLPAQWGKNQKGMQSMETLGPEEAKEAELAWRLTLGYAIAGCTTMSKIGVHKQWANRVIEPWMHITVLLTATEWGNFFNLRAHPDAHPDFQQLAYRMLARYRDSAPEKLAWGQWHIPFKERMEDGILSIQERLKVSTARAARLSYLTQDGEIDYQKDFGIHDRLIGPGHWSPFEHTAKAEPVKPDYWPELEGLLRETDRFDLEKALRVDLQRDQGNLRGWTPYRKQFPGENKSELDMEAVMARKPDWITLETN